MSGDSTSHDTILDDIDLLYEAGTLRHIDRAWRQFGGLPFANVAEHSFRTALIAMLIAVREGAHVGRVVQMALIHDLHESRVGDANYVQKMYRSEDVDGAISEIVGSTSLSAHLRTLHGEMIDEETLEARIVKDADKLDCDFELQEMDDAGARIAMVLKPTREAVGTKLHTATARRIYAALQNRRSHEWHMKARNRLNAGDWSRE